MSFYHVSVTMLSALAISVKKTATIVCLGRAYILLRVDIEQ